MNALTRPLVVAVFTGALALLCYEAWDLTPDLLKGSVLADFPYLWALVAIFALLSLAEGAIAACSRALARRRALQ